MCFNVNVRQIVLRKVRVSHKHQSFNRRWVPAGFSHTEHAHVRRGGAKDVGGAGLHSRAVAQSQLVFIVAEFSQGHLSAELHHLPEHLLG